MSNRRWTNDEITYLEENWGTVSIKAISKKLQRSEVAIISRARKLKLGSFIEAGDLLSLGQLIKALGQSNCYWWVKKKFIDNEIPIIYKTIITKKVAKIGIDDFWKWAEKNKNILNFARFEKGALGKEPYWVDKKRKADLINPSKHNSNRPWTNSDDILLISKVKSCKYTYRDLASEFNRTEAAIKRRLYDLNVPYRPVPLNNQIKWTDEENEKMVELYKNGYDTYAISRALNKTHLSISDRLRARGY